MKKLTLLLLVSLVGLQQASAQINDVIWVTLMGVTGVPASDRGISGVCTLYGDKTITSTSNGPLENPYTNGVNYFDTYIASNAFEVMGIKRPYGALDLWVECKSWIGTEDGKQNDTLPLYIQRLRDLSTYHIQVICNLSAAHTQIGKLIDNYPYPSVTPSSVPLQMTGFIMVQGTLCGVVDYPFNVNPADAPGVGTKAADRFSVVLSKNVAFRPFRFDSQSGILVGNNKVKFTWNTAENEEVVSYEIQEQVAPKKFTSLTKVSVDQYQKGIEINVANPKTKKFRIKANFNTGKSATSNLFMLTRQTDVQPQIVPAFRVINPVQGRTMQLAFDGDYGRSQVQIVNTRTGERISVATITASGTVFIPVNVPTGAYVVSVIPEQGPAPSPRKIEIHQ